MASCGKDIEDPAATFSAGTPAATAGSDTGPASTSGDNNEEEDDDDSSVDQGNDDTTGAGDETPMDTMPAEETGPAQTDGPVDDGMDDMGGGCGDGVVSPGEQCDGADLQGFDCGSLGLAGGTLNCDAVTCTFDTSMCMSGGPGTGGLQ